MCVVELIGQFISKPNPLLIFMFRSSSSLSPAYIFGRRILCPPLTLAAVPFAAAIFARALPLVPLRAAAAAFRLSIVWLTNVIEMARRVSDCEGLTARGTVGLFWMAELGLGAAWCCEGC